MLGGQVVALVGSRGHKIQLRWKTAWGPDKSVHCQSKVDTIGQKWRQWDNSGRCLTKVYAIRQN